MDTKFWLNKWKKKEIGFHYEDANDLLISTFNRLHLESDSNILVPLCGKTADLLWLMHQGVNVYGVELSKVAIEEFFVENALEYTTETENNFTVYISKNIRIYQGDFFLFREHIRIEFDAVYDRASLVALPFKMREKYYFEINALLKNNAHYLLISLEYNQDAMNGPPFSVTKDEITKYLDFEILEEEKKSDEKMSNRTKTDTYTFRYLFKK